MVVLLMVPALILVLAAWCPITTTTATGPDRAGCPCDTPTTTTVASTTTSSAPPLMIEPPHPIPPETPTDPTTTTTTAAAVAVPTLIADSVVATRPEPQKRLPVTGPNGDELVVAGTLLFLGGLLVAATRTGKHP